MKHPDKEKYIIKTQNGYISGSIKDPSERNTSVVKTKDPKRALKFINKYEAQNWAASYKLDNYTTLTLNNAIAVKKGPSFMNEAEVFDRNWK